MDGIKLDLNDLKGKRENNGKAKKIDMDDLRYDEMIDAQIDRYRNKDKMTISDIMAMQQLEDMKWERRQRMKAEIEPQKSPIDIEEIIRKAQEPLQKQIDAMQKLQEKQAEERKWEIMQKQIDKLTDLIISGNTKKNDDDNPIMKQIQILQEQLKDEKEKARKKEEEDFRSSMKDMVYSLSDQIAELKSKPEKSKSDFEQIIELERKKREMLEALGVKPEKGKDDEASMLDVVDSIADKAPKWAKTASTIREVFSKDSEIPDDIPDNVPTNLPQRNEPIPQRNMIPDDIRTFLDKGREENGKYIDYTGTPWVNLEGTPISRKDIEDLAYTNPSDVRKLISDTDKAFQKMQEKIAESEAKKPKNSDFRNNIHVPENIPKAPEPEPEDEEDDNEPAAEEQEDHLKEAMDYIATGNDVDDDENGKVWVGRKQEFYTNDDGKPATKDDLIQMARSDPKTFMSDVKQHLASLEGENGK
ncbi:hypothetical protein [Ferrimicrobium sp.]|uniref:hypothetical protein n=1 Tax=Ferrimicrobium sp. TaxID=2926050 RepID=UPI002604A8A6|nr:hypothetical protein [Ferrimicrobium sp.]